MSSHSHVAHTASFPRRCFNVDGTPKRAYHSFDAAQAMVALVEGQHAYRCHEHGWHLGRNKVPHCARQGRTAMSVLDRKACPACFGGKRVAGGDWGNSHTFVHVGKCLRCNGSGVECDEDYALRIASHGKRKAVAA